MREWSGGRSPLREAEVWAAAFAGLLIDAAFDTVSRGHLPWIFRVSPLVVVLLVSSGAAVSPAQALGIGLLGFAFFDGFVVNTYGDLTWTRRAGWVQLVVFLGCALAARRGAHRLARRPHLAAADVRSST